jgi:hypothetical protein
LSFDEHLFDEQIFSSQGFSEEGCLFDEALFDSAIFDTCDEQVVVSTGGGWPPVPDPRKRWAKEREEREALRALIQRALAGDLPEPVAVEVKEIAKGKDVEELSASAIDALRAILDDEDDIEMLLLH